MHGRYLLNRGLKQRIGNGDSISVWIDTWIFYGHWRLPLIKNKTIDLLLMVKDLIDPGIRGWNIQKLEELFYPVDVLLILKTKPTTSVSDYWTWKYNKT